MHLTEDEYRERVTRGVALLDEKRPGWEREISLSHLDIGSGSYCVTAQLSGSFNWREGMHRLGLTDGDDGTYVSHGFNSESFTDEDIENGHNASEVFDTLNKLWREVITERLS